MYDLCWYRCCKDKHDCCILESEADKLYPVFTIPNNKAGFDELYEKIFTVTDDKTKIKVGLEATGHYSLNLLGSLIDKGLPTCVINPLHTNLYRKGLSLRKTKTDKVDARSIAMMLMTNKTLKPYSDTSYHSEELKSLTRYRFDKVQERAKLKSSVARLVNILFRNWKTRSQPSYGFDVCLAVQTPRSLLHYRMSSYPSQKSPRNSL